jgi:5-methylcytosine-specific restriction endonuclease McrA
MLKNCLNCNNEYHVKPFRYNESKFCSKSCQAKKQKETMAGKNNPNYKDAGKKECLLCKSQYHTYNSKRKYCSDKCASIANRKKPEDKAQRKKTQTKKTYECKDCKEPTTKNRMFCVTCSPKENSKTEINCKICNEKVETYKSRLRVYCSKECQFIDYKNEGNPNYIDGRTPENKKIRNSKKYKDWRIAVFQRDNYTCVICKKVGNQLNADHIKPFCNYPELRFDLDNGRTLCEPCHKETDTFLVKARWK